MSRYLEIANIIQKQNPDLQLFVNTGRNAIGYWSDGLNRVQVLVSEVLGGGWAAMPEILVNGVPCFAPEDWAPISYQEMEASQ